MKAKGKRLQASRPANLNETIISAWRKMGAQSVGKAELLAIQQIVGDELSPASIARELASAGAELRHPDIIQCDAAWRENQIAMRIKPFAGLKRWEKSEPLKLKDAEALIAKLEALRLRAAGEDEGTLGDIKRLGVDARLRALALANDPSLESFDREEQAEIAEWVRVWLETPQIFSHWLDLRKSSPAFKKKFGKD